MSRAVPTPSGRALRHRIRSVRDAGERGLIRLLARLVDDGRHVIRGIGDDCAVVRIPGSHDDWLLTTDPVIEGVHFLPGTPGRRIGHKAAGRVISDIAAMGGTPLYVLFDLVAPPTAPLRQIEDAYRGATALCRRWGAAVIGGDVAKGDRLELHAFAVGRVPRGGAVLRCGARPGHRIFVTGELGGSILGHHLTFEPRVAEGAWLARRRLATSMMDLSDGLASDLRRLMEESGVGARIRADAVPISAAARRLRDGRSALDHALGDGEDFELLFTVHPQDVSALRRAWPRRFSKLRLSEIGVITAETGRLDLLSGERHIPIAARGYEHFVSEPGASPHVRRR
ncbi:MAG: thiamine-phosphate kinase [Kiritimatiellae bacterium]|nr:thiamine-phosphate kinase [Kiritimatiellia bacterium]